jgi:hypothetical protein
MRTFSGRKFSPFVLFFFALATAPVNLRAADTPSALPPPANVKINFDRDILPIFNTSCLRCHGPPKAKSHFRLDYREGALAGGDDNTNDVVPGDSRNSLLIAYVAGQDPDMQMPPAGKGEPLTPQQIALLRAWIDQGAHWSTSNQPPSLSLAVEPMFRYTAVQGNQPTFRELEGVREGFGGGVQNFSSTDRISPDETISLNGYAIVPDQNFNAQLSLDKTDQGFIHAGFDQWRKYYATDGGYDPTVTPPQFNLNDDLYVDNDRAWIDLGLTKPRWPEIILGYEFQYRTGNESTLDWGYANGKNIYPATQSLNEQTHTIKLDLAKNLDDWQLENHACVEFYTLKNTGSESAILFGGPTPDQFITTRDNYQQIRGMDTLTLEKPLRDWWLLSGGFYYSKLAGSDYFNQTTAIPSFGVNSVLSSQQITLNRESEIFSIANLFTPLHYLSLSLGLQNEWTSENGFSESIPDLEFGGNVPANSSLGEFKASQNANFRFTKIPFSIVSGDAEFSENNYNIYQGEDTNILQRDTAADNFRYDLKTGFSTSPWEWVDWTAQYERQSSDTHYNQLQDIFGGVPGPTNGYPAFILARTITGDQFETKLVLRPAAWLKTTLTYQITDTDYSSRTDPAFDYTLNELVSEGGSIADGHSDLHTYGIGATVTPFRQLYLSGTFTYSQSRVTTADNGDPSIVPYDGNIFTVNATAFYVLNIKSSFQVSDNFSSADYSQNNALAGIPAGLNYQRDNLIVGLTRKLSKNLSGTLKYEFSQFKEPSSANANNYMANGVMATLVYNWP